MKPITLVHFAELFLKGKNRDWFVQKLVRNINRICGGKVIKRHSYLLLEKGRPENLKFVTGISWWGRGFVTEKEFEALKQACKKLLAEEKPENFKIEVKRGDKSFPLTSTELAAKLGSALEKELKIKAELEKPAFTIFVEIQRDEAIVVKEKIRGLGGLPVSTSGKGLLLFSGGIDSPVAGHLMQRRGMHIDLVHFHVFTKAEKLKETKIFELAKILARFQSKIRLYAVPYYLFQMKALEFESNELVLFRRFMLKVAEKLAKETGSKALITGDSLGQVASQTIENLQATDSAVKIIVLRPLIGLDKEQIVKIAKEIGTYEPSIKPYKDCCSIITRKAKTRSNLKKLEEIEEKIEVEKLVEETLKLTEEIEI
jgi:thiamine biosynthesis protein ThiI